MMTSGAVALPYPLPTLCPLPGRPWCGSFRVSKNCHDSSIPLVGILL